MFSAEEARVLNRLMLGAGTSAPVASTAALRRARVRGAGLEFQEYRHYEPGDDPRSIDWTVEARLRQLVVRVSRADGHVRLHVLVDASASMSLGAPDKWSCARALAGALCYVAQERRDIAGLAVFDGGVRRYVPPAAGRAQLFRAFSLLDGTAPGGASDINRSLLQYGAAARGPGLAVVVSDFFGQTMPFDGLQYLQHRGLAPAIVQVVARDELEPDVDGDVELVDVEHPQSPPLVVDARAVSRYQARLEAHRAQIDAYCREHGIPFLRLVSDTSFGARMAALQSAGLVSAYG
jgi:uncharacterized protein (DUF58 family)